MVYDVTFLYEMDVTLFIDFVLKLCGVMVQTMVVVMLRKLSLSQRLNYDIAMDVSTDIVWSISINRVSHLDVEKWLLVQHFVFRIMIVRLKSVICIDMVI